ncbi:MAG: HAD-IIB family hydrolase [Candidatus Berkelbacteria bacterium]
MNNLTSKILFSDLDGTFLDHHDYSFERSYEALNTFLEQGNEVVFVTSKTAAEVFALFSALKEKGLKRKLSFIVENGAAIYLSEEVADQVDLDKYDEVSRKDYLGYIILSFGRADYSSLRSVLKKEVEPRIGKIVYGFGDFSDQALSELTGLTLEQAALSKKRDCDEPFYIENGLDADYDFAKQIITDHGLHYHRGGRFAHISIKQDKGSAVKLFINIVKQIAPGIITYGVGDAPNDVSFLQVCDKGFLLSGSTKVPEVLPSNIRNIEKVGQAGFAEVAKVISR